RRSRRSDRAPDRRRTHTGLRLTFLPAHQNHSRPAPPANTGTPHHRSAAMGTRTRCLAAFSLLAFALAPAALPAQGPAGQQRGERPALITASSDPLLRSFRWRSIGPANMGGRVD